MRNNAIFNYSSDSYKDFLAIINKKNYLFRATLINPDNRMVDIYKSAIKELYLNDNVFNPFMNGYVVIDNREDAIERYVTDPAVKEFNANAVLARGYRTRGDARDILMLSIVPIINGVNPYDSSSEEFNAMFGFRYVFALTNETDISDQNGKLKKYDILDFDQQILSEKNSFFSTVQMLDIKNASELTNNEREVETGKILKKMLADNLNDSSSIFTTVSGNKKITPYFEDGSSKIFYTSPANYTALDDIMYISSLHVSSDVAHDFSFLKKDNYTGEYSLESASSIFSKAYNKSTDSGGDYFIENFTVAGGQSNSNIFVNDVKKPLKALEFGETGDILEIKFLNPSGGLYQNKIKTTIVHSYSFLAKQFILNCEDGNIEAVKDTFTELYVNPMKGKNNSPAPNLILTNTQKTNQNYDNQFLVYTNHSDYIQMAVGRNKILKNALIQNIGVEITVQGALLRKSGCFISIDRQGSYIDNDFDDKFLGIYFVLNVDHTFVNDEEYLNKIIAVKTYQFKDLKTNENIP